MPNLEAELERANAAMDEAGRDPAERVQLQMLVRQTVALEGVVEALNRMAAVLDEISQGELSGRR